MADSRAHLLTDRPCTVIFALASDGVDWYSDSDDSSYFDWEEDDKDDMKALLGPAGVSKKRPYLTTAYYDAKSRPECFSASMQRNPGWMASPEAFNL